MQNYSILIISTLLEIVAKLKATVSNYDPLRAIAGIKAMTSQVKSVFLGKQFSLLISQLDKNH